MSYILEALKKSESRRRLGQDPVYRGAGRPPGPVLLRWVSLVAGLLLLLALLLAVLVIAGRDPLTATAPAAGPDAAMHPPLETPSTTAATAPGAPAFLALQEKTPAEQTPSRLSPQLADQIEAPSSSAAIDTARAPAVRSRSQPVPAARVEGTPWLSSLPDDFRQSLPPLTVNIHVFTPDPNNRILYINNRPVQPGGTTAGGVVVEEIVPEGVVLRYHGQRFKLPRPS